MARGIVTAGCVLAVVAGMPLVLTAQGPVPTAPARETAVPAKPAPEKIAAETAPAAAQAPAPEAAPATEASQAKETTTGVPDSIVETRIIPATTSEPQAPVAEPVTLSGTAKAAIGGADVMAASGATFTTTDEKTYVLKLDEKGKAILALPPATRVDIKGTVATETDESGITVEILTVTSFREHVRPINMTGTVESTRDADGKLTAMKFITFSGNSLVVTLNEKASELAGLPPGTKVQVRCTVITETDENDKTINKMTVIEFKEVKPAPPEPVNM